MWKSRLFVFALALVLLVSAFAGAGGANAAPAGLTVRISADKATIGAGESALVTVTVSNNSKRAAKVLKWFTPYEDVEEPLFSVMRDGQAVAYTGALYKRPAPTAADYASLKPGQSFTRTVDLGAYYDLSESGNYSIQYNVASWNLHSEKGNLLNGAASLSSNKLELAIQGRAGTTVREIAPAAVTGSTTFTKCTTTQQTDLNAARSQASTYSTNSLAYLTAGTQGLRYTTWFGVFDATRYNTVKTHFTAISNAMDTAPVTFNCGCKKKYYAYVYPNQPYTIYLCSVFWTAPLTGTDSKAGTLIHEMSHFYVVASTDDWVYGQAGAKNLAITDPAKAITNADNHEYFAENTPSQP